MRFFLYSLYPYICLYFTCLRRIWCSLQEKYEGWWIYLVDRKIKQLVTKPVYINSLETEEEVRRSYPQLLIPHRQYPHNMLVAYCSSFLNLWLHLFLEVISTLFAFVLTAM